MIYFLDGNQEVIKIVRSSAVISAIQTQELPEDNSLLRDYLSVHLKSEERLSGAQYMAIKSYGGNRNAFDLYRITSENAPDNTTEFVGVQVAPYELEGVVIEDLRPQNRSLSQTMNQVLTDSDWRLGYVADNLPAITTTFYYVSAKDALKSIQELASVEMIFRVEISGNEITDKWVEVYHQLGNRTMKRFNYGTNALSVIRESSHGELYTALIGRGKGEEVGETESGDATYGRKINFADVEWKKSAGKPVDKPKGQKYIELPNATSEYGVKLLDGRKAPRIGLVEFSETEDPEKLIQETYEELLERSRPKVLFKANVINIGDVLIGDTVTIHRHNLNLHYKARVRKVIRDRKNNDKTQVEIGDVVHTPSTRRHGRINSALNNLATGLESIRGEITEARSSADGKNTNFYGNVEPERKKVGDTWFRDHPSLTGESQILVWNGEVWELIMDTSETTKNADAIEKTLEEVEEAKRQAKLDANQALADAKAHADAEDARIKQELESEVGGAIELAEQAKQDAIDRANQALIDAKAHADAEVSRIDIALSTEIGGAIELAEQAKADAVTKANQAYKDAVTEADRLAAIRDDGITIEAGQITAGVIDAARLDAVSIVTSGLTANVIKSTHIETSTATIDKLFANDATVNRLTAKTAFINSIKAVEIDASKISSGTINTARLNAIEIITQGLTTNVIKSNHIETSTATIDKLFANETMINRLTSKTAFINSIKAVEIDAGKITSGTINTARLNATEIVTQGLTADVVKSNHILADTALFDKLFTSTLATDRLSAQTAWIKNGMFANASIDGAKIQDATIGSAKITNLDVGKISGNKAEFITASFNGINSSTQIDADGIYMSGFGFWRRTYLTSTGFDLFNAGGSNKSGAIGYFKPTSAEASDEENIMLSSQGSRHTIGMVANASHNVALGYGGVNSRTYNRALQVDGDTGLVRLYTNLVSGNSVSGIRLRGYDSGSYYGTSWERENSGIMFANNGTKIWDESGRAWDDYDMTTRRKIGFYGDSGVQVLTANSDMEIWAGGESVRFYVGTNALRFRVGRGSIQAYADIGMNGNIITGQSDERLKTNIRAREELIINKLKQFNFVDFDWIESGKSAFGLIAQQVQKFAPELVNMDETNMLTLNNTMLNMYTTKSVVEINQKVDELTESTDDKIHKLQQELSKANRRIEELEGAI